MAVYTPQLGATALIDPGRVRLEYPSHSLYISQVKGGDSGTWYCRVDSGLAKGSAYNLMITGRLLKLGQLMEMEHSSFYLHYIQMFLLHQEDLL